MKSENSPQLRSVKSHISDQLLRLPPEIIEDILSRLPVKSLVKFRCVSKPWRSLICSQRFIYKHLANSTRNASFSHHKIILRSLKPQRGLKQCSLRSMLDDPFTNQFRFINSLNWDKSIIVVGCCNGLVCILNEERHFMLWNPSTRMIKELPVIDPEINFEFEVATSCGFGFDCLSGDYKVFVVVSVDWNPAGRNPLVKVYSLETDSWTRVEIGDVLVSHLISCNGEGKFASGRLHWLSSNIDSGYDEIISFDLRSEVSGVVELPCSDDCCVASMEVIEGRLGVLVDHLSRLDIWVMKEYGVRESWEKVVTLPQLDRSLEGSIACPCLLGLGPNGEVLLTVGSSFVIYYREGDGYRHIQLLESLAQFREAQIYVESLVSLGEEEACSRERVD